MSSDDIIFEGGSQNSSSSTKDLKDDDLTTLYTPLEFIGKGGGGSVVKAQHKIDKQIYAIKQITSNTEAKWKKDCEEAEILAQFYHENIVRYHTSWISTKDMVLALEDTWTGIGESTEEESSSMEVDPQPHQHKRLYIAMEYCSNNLKELLEEMAKTGTHLSNSREHWKWVASIIRSVANAIEFLHKNGYFHRDLKPENILFDSKGVAKICDFGLTKKRSTPPHPEGEEEENHSPDVGTPLYQSPEQAAKKGYNHSVDIYQLGLIMFKMIKPESTNHELADIKKGKNSETHAPPRLNDLFSKMISQDANDRPDAKSVSSACSHFLKEFLKDKKKKMEKQ